MNRITRMVPLGLAALAAMALVALDTNSAQAAHGFGGFGGFGLHFGGRNVHLDIGNPHGRYNGYAQRQQLAHRTYYPQQRARAHYDWHDTSHYDYHPGGFVRHGNHLDYRRGHYDLHQEGHFDRHRGSHHGGSHQRGRH